MFELRVQNGPLNFAPRVRPIKPNYFGGYGEELANTAMQFLKIHSEQPPNSLCALNIVAWEISYAQETPATVKTREPDFLGKLSLLSEAKCGPEYSEPATLGRMYLAYADLKQFERPIRLLNVLELPIPAAAVPCNAIGPKMVVSRDTSFFVDELEDQEISVKVRLETHFANEFALGRYEPRFLSGWNYSGPNPAWAEFDFVCQIDGLGPLNKEGSGCRVK